MRKKYTLIPITLLLCIILTGCTLYSKNDISQKTNKIYQTVQSVLPNGWSISAEENKLIVGRDEKVWFYNQINMPAFLGEKELENFAKSMNFASRYEIYIDYTDRWSDEKLKSVTEANKAIQTEMANLPEKHNLTNLINKFDEYIGSNEEEQKRVEAYEKEKSELEAKVQKLPDFNTNEYSIFISTNQSWSSGIWPTKAGEEIYKTEELIKANLEKMSGK